LSTGILRRLGAAAAGLMIVAGLATPAMAASAAPAAMAKHKTPTCVVSAYPYRFVETGLGAGTSSVTFIIAVECKPVYSEQYVELQTPQLNNICHGTLKWYSATSQGGAGESYRVSLDDDGNATVAVSGGPSCAASSALIEADLTVAPFTTATVKVKIAPPVTTKKGLFAFPAREVEDATTSSVVAIFYAEFPSVYAESTVEISDAQLFDRCGGRIVWFGPDLSFLVANTKSVTTTLDNNGNAFVVALAGPSCASGRTLAEADLVGPPYTTLTTKFTVLSPRVTV
jgi:hypothetical protein